jgi:hypothetical protein
LIHFAHFKMHYRIDTLGSIQCSLQ